MDQSPAAKSASIPPEKIAEAWKIVRPVLWRTDLLPSPALDEITGYRVWLKPENLQHTGSYKIRGAYYKLRRLKERKGVSRVIAASAGNHAQGVAWAARELGMECMIVMPERAPLPKRRATQRYGAQLVLRGNCFDDALEYALNYAPAAGWEFISPFDDIDVITGQSTLGWELAEEMNAAPPNAVIVPVGGGGLLAGIAAAWGQRLPGAKIVAVQSASAPAYVRSWEAYRKSSPQALPLDIATQETIADGARVRQPGRLCWEISRDLVSDALVLDEPQIYQGILFLLEESKMVAEGAGALGVAALLDPAARDRLRQADIPPGSNVVVLVTGGNIDTLTLYRVLERGMAANGREQSLSVRIKDEAQLSHIFEFLRRKRATVLDLRRSWKSRALISDIADIEMLIETEDERHGREVLQELSEEAKRMNFELLSENDAQ